MPYVGEISALVAAFLWGGCAMMFESAGKRIGAFSTNLLRILMAALFLCATLYMRSGYFIPINVSKQQLFWLGSSGIIGLALGDAALFKSLVILGSRRATLLLSLAPPITAILAWIFLRERLSVLAVTGILLTMWGVYWVVSEEKVAEETRGSKLNGVVCGIIGAIGQGVGVIFAKYGLITNIDSLSATILRMIPAALALWFVALLSGRAPGTIKALTNLRAGLATLGGAILGPYVGVWLSLIAVKYTEAGVAATLLATVPVVILPMVYVVHKHIPSWRSVIGTVIAVGGIVFIFLR
jgi:drug/metabolite transporter (DMT)-like permease